MIRKSQAATLCIAARGDSLEAPLSYYVQLLQIILVEEFPLRKLNILYNLRCHCSYDYSGYGPSTGKVRSNAFNNCYKATLILIM